MVKRSDESVTTYSDHQVIVPPNKLAKAVARADAGSGPHDDVVARAEQALANLSTEFTAWMESECARLDQARCDAKASGFASNAIQLLFRAAHDIKGEAETFGFPLIAPVADSLCRLIEHTPEPNLIPVTLVDQHVDAVRAILREKANANDKTAQELASELRAAADAFLLDANKDRPDALAAILAPPTAPGG